MMPPLVRSWITPKAAKGGASAIEGRGVHAVVPIAAGEIVAVKGGHLVDRATVDALPAPRRPSCFPLADDVWLAALAPEEHDGVMMRINHSCEPSVGMGGNVVLVAMRPIEAGEELTIDYAMFLGHDDFEMSCNCEKPLCRNVIRGTDWRLTDLQRRYRGWFAWWLQQKIDGNTQR
jgi:SET domain-containing protein